MGKYIKLFHDTSSADGFLITNIPFVCSLNDIGVAMTNEPYSMLIASNNDIHIAGNKIYYTTVDGNPYPLEQI